MCNCKIRTSSLTSSQFRIRKVISEKQHVNGHNPAKQAHKIWRKNFKGLLSYHILGVGSFFLAAPCRSKAQLDAITRELTGKSSAIQGWPNP